jgi:hypothetical protein
LTCADHILLWCSWASVAWEEVASPRHDELGNESANESVQGDSNRHGPCREDHHDEKILLFHGTNHGRVHKEHPCVCSCAEVGIETVNEVSEIGNVRRSEVCRARSCNLVLVRRHGQGNESHREWEDPKVL